MKNFKEYLSEGRPKEDNVYSTYVKDFGGAIEHIGSIIEYGRSIDMDNKLINPLLDAIKGLHLADDAIRVAYEKSIAPEEKEEEPVVEPTEEKQW